MKSFEINNSIEKINIFYIHDKTTTYKLHVLKYQKNIFILWLLKQDVYFVI